MNKTISVLGSTGSIGTQTLEVARECGIKVSAIAAKKNINLLETQIREFKPKIAAVFDEKAASELKKNVADTSTKVVSGMEGLCDVACENNAEIVLTAVSGMIGITPTLKAIQSKKTIALANKETLVAGGELVMQEAAKNGVDILPVDSEHSAIFQCLQGCKDKKHINKLILTASGGPFFGKTKSELESVTIKDTLNHPNWDMGAKITVDSATMMNKGLEIIEATHLFGIDEAKIDVLIHRESILHSAVEFIDGAIIAQMGVPTMKTPIRYAISYPNRINSQDEKLNLAKIRNLSFFEPDYKTFEALTICREALRNGGSSTLIINSANEEAVGMFLNQKIKFNDIIKLIKLAQKQFKPQKISSLEEILKIDSDVRSFIKSLV